VQSYSAGARVKRLVPLFDRVLVEKASPVRKVGSVYLPENAAQKLNYGRVMAVGKGRLLENGNHHPLSVKVGDHVMLSGDWAGTTVKVNEKELLMVREDEIIGLIELEDEAK
jgi:chaperonin GroES